MNADGSNPRRVTFESEVNSHDIAPTWSPDGRYIAFASNRAAHEDGAFRYDIYSIRSDGSGETLRLTNGESQSTSPAWRPDGSAPPSNQAPIADAGSDVTAFRSTPAAASVSLDGTHSSDPDGDALQFTWLEGVTQIATGSNPTVELPLGVHTIELHVSDGRGGEATDGVVITVSNRAPVVVAGGPYTGFEGTALPFSANATDADGDGLAYSWSFGDGITGSGTSLPTSHSYADNGSYTVAFSADDGNAGNDTKSATVAIQNLAPSVRATADVTVVSGALFNFSEGFSDRGVKDNPWDWRLSWGEGLPTTGTTMNQEAPIVAQHRYLTVGTYRTELSVTDKDGGAGTATMLVTVIRQNVTLDALPFIPGSTPTVYYNPKKPAMSEPVIIAILGTSDFAPFDPTTKRAAVNLASVRLGHVAVASLNGIYAALPADVNRDGRLDLVLTFQTDKLVQATDLDPTLSTLQSLTLHGDHIDGRQFTGTQKIRLVTRPGLGNQGS
jgi:hypothetical protein